MSDPINSTAYSPDPWTQAYRALRNWLLVDVDLMKLVKVKCVPDLAGTDPEPIPDTINDANLPELVLMPVSGGGRIGRTNVDHGATQFFALRMSTAEIGQLAAQHFPVTWAIFCSFVRLARTGGANGIQPGRLGLPFVERVVLREWTSTAATLKGRMDGEDQGTIGWVTLFSIEVGFHFSDKAIGTVR